MKIDFYADTHEYRVDGRRVSSVTQILKQEGFIDSRWYQPSGTNRGSMVHELTEQMDKGTLKADHLSGSEVYPYLAAWEKFKEDIGNFSFINIEDPVATELYAGIPDRIAVINHKNWLIDIKTGQHELWHGLQLAAYEMGINNTFDIPIDKRRVVHLKANGKYSICDKDKRVGAYDDSIWKTMWTALLQSRVYKQQYAKIKPGDREGLWDNGKS